MESISGSATAKEQTKNLFSQLESQALQDYLNDNFKHEPITCGYLQICLDERQLIELKVKNENHHYQVEIPIHLATEVFATSVEQLALFNEATFYEIDAMSLGVLKTFLAGVVREYLRFKAGQQVKKNLDHLEHQYQERVKMLNENFKIFNERIEEPEQISRELSDKLQQSERGTKMINEIQKDPELKCLETYLTEKEVCLREQIKEYEDISFGPLQAITKNDIIEVRSMPGPPQKIIEVFMKLMIIQNRKPTWENARQQLEDKYFLKKLQENLLDQALKLHLNLRLQIRSKLSSDEFLNLKQVNKFTWLICGFMKFALSEQNMHFKKIKQELKHLEYIQAIIARQPFNYQTEINIQIDELKSRLLQDQKQYKVRLSDLNSEFKLIHMEGHFLVENLSRGIKIHKVLQNAQSFTEKYLQIPQTQDIQLQVAMFYSNILTFGTLLSSDFHFDYMKNVKNALKIQEFEEVDMSFNNLNHLYQEIYQIPIVEESSIYMLSFTLHQSQKPKIIFDPTLLGKKSFVRNEDVVVISFNSKSLIQDIEAVLEENKICFVLNSKLPFHSGLIDFCSKCKLSKNIYFQTYASHMNVKSDLIEKFQIVNLIYLNGSVKSPSQTPIVKSDKLIVFQNCKNKIYNVFGKSKEEIEKLLAEEILDLDNLPWSSMI